MNNSRFEAIDEVIMKEIITGGISYITRVPRDSNEWYYGISREYGDLYEAEEIYRGGRALKGNEMCLIHYPDGEIYRPLTRETNVCLESPILLNESVYFLRIDFAKGSIRILRFDCRCHDTGLVAEIPLRTVKNCYNLRLHTAPLTLTRQGDEGVFEVIWPERSSFQMDPHESFFLRDGDRFYFNKWFEEGDGESYRYWEETVVHGLDGTLIEEMDGDIQTMPNGELWHIR